MKNSKDYKLLLEKTAEFAKMGSWEVNLIKNKIYWSDVMKKIHEVEKDYECDMEEALSFYDENSLKKVTDAYGKAISEGLEYDIKIQILTKKKRRIWVRAIGIPEFENGECVRVYGLFQDIDKQEKAALDSYSRMKIINDLFLISNIGLIIFDLEGKVTRVNKGFTEILGYTNEDLRNLAYKDFCHPEDLESSRENRLQLLNGEKKSISSKKKYIKKSGEVVYALAFASLIRDKKGKPLYFIGQMVDNTPQNESQKKMQALLNVTTDQNQRLLNFAHIVSHNLKSHAGNLKMLLELMDMEYPELRGNELMPMFGHAVENLGDTIKHLNEVVLVQTSDKKNFQEVNLDQYIQQTLNSISGLILDEKAEIDNTVSQEISLRVVPAYLESILLNLLSNTLRYKSETRTLKVKIHTEIIDDFLVLNVQDNGLGIDLEAHGENLFGMYKTFHNHKDSRGIGLFITKNQIEAMGGKIEVESKVNQGTTFKLYFKNGEKN